MLTKYLFSDILYVTHCIFKGVIFVSFLKTIRNALFGDSNKEEATLSASKPLSAKPKPPRKGKLTYKGKSLSETKRIIHNQKLKSSEEFDNNVKECKEWLENISGFYQLTPVGMDMVERQIDKLNQKELLALRAALSEFPDIWGPFSGSLHSFINENIEYKMKRYTFQKKSS